MSKDRRKLLHIHSSVNDKQPTPATLELGELGVNNAKGNAFISTKNSDGEVVRFSEDETLIGWIEQKEVFPYEAYVRGADNSQVDGVTEQDLLDNKSNIIIKLNQVVPENTDYSPYDEKVNGAKDIYGNLINPISAGGYKDGAGIAIDMSQYVMQGANPSFSSITTNCHATFNGTTEIKGKGDGCGSQFTVEVANACIDASDTLNEYGVDNSNFGTSCDGTKVSNNTTLKGKKISIDSPSGDLTVDIQACNHVSARTNDFVVRECQNNEGKVEIDTTDVNVSAETVNVKSCDLISANTNNYVLSECTDGQGSVKVDTTNLNVSATTTDVKSNNISAVTNNFVINGTDDNSITLIKSCGEIRLESKNITFTDGDCGSGQTTMEVHDLCLVGENKINVYGDTTNVGLDCNDANVASNTNVYGKEILVSATTADIEEVAVNITETASGKITNTASGNIETLTNADIKETAVNITETASGNVNVTANGNVTTNGVDINENASNDICSQAANNATFYGAVKTNVGINCDDTATAATTTVKGGKVIVDASTTDLGLTAKKDILESAEGNINITANDGICETAGDSASFYGANITRIGISCDGEDFTTNLEIGGVNACIEGDEKAGIFGAEISNLGISCDGADRSALTNVSGDTVNVGGNEINISADNSIILNAADEVNVNATEDINLDSSNAYITASNELCEKADKAYFYGTNSTTIGKGCDDTLSSNITYWRNAEPVCDNGVVGFSATTVDGALDEVYYRSQVNVTQTGETVGIDVPVPESGTSIVRSGSTTYTIHQDSDGCDKTFDFVVDNTIVSMSAQTYGAADEMAKKYTLWQYLGDTRVEIGEINIPKDHILKDASIVNGHADGESFTACTAGDDSCHWYIKLVWNVFDPSTGHADDKTVYLPADDFVTDIVADNSDTNRGINLTVWYDGSKNHISGDTILNYISTDGAFNYEKKNGEHFISGTSLIFNEGSFTATTYEPWYDTKTVKIPTDLSHLNRKKLTASHNGVNYEYDPAIGSGWTLSHDNLTITYGNTCGQSDNSVTYNTSEAKNIIIPKTISHITNGTIALNEDCSGSCITVNGDICMQNNTIAAKALYSTSDMNLKENINGIQFEDYHKAADVAFKSFNFKNDESKTKTYGVIAQDVQNAGLGEIVRKNEQGELSVDYISLLVLKIADLENKVKELTEKLNNN